MYGDCQVMQTIGGNMVPPEALFSSPPPPLQNPNYGFMPFHSFHSAIPKDENNVNGGGFMMMGGGRDELMMMESGSGSDQVEDKSGNELELSSEQQHQQEPNKKKKRYHRHTARQIQEMEALFKECPHPDDKQRLRLSQELGLKPRQVKFWFQNRRTQMKAQQDRTENVMLRAENESLKNENYRLQAELRNIVCPNCGGPAVLGGIAFEEIRLENARLREELDRLCCLASRYSGRQIQPLAPAPTPALMVQPSLDLDMNMYSRHFSEPMTTGSEMMPTIPMLQSETSPFPAENSPLVMEAEKSMAMELAISSVDELVKMCRAGEPLWVCVNASGKEVLNLEEHSRIFPWPLNKMKHQSSEFRSEASRGSAVVIMNAITLVDAFLDANKWMDLFPSIVAKAKTVQVIASAGSSASGTLQLMYAELQILSPLVPTREAYFLRYCRQNVEEGTWTIVDFPIDSLHNNIQTSFPLLYRRRASGCIIQDMPNGYSRVTWIEHAEVEEKPVHQIFADYVYGGMAFGAHRWLAVLQRQCERVASLMARNIADLGVIPSPEARKNLMRLAQRMIRTFSVNISTSGGQIWTALSDSPADTVRITTRKITEPGQPNGLILGAVSTIWLPYPHHQVFDLLRDERRRSQQLDVLSNGNTLHEVAHIANGSHPGNCISLLRINVASNSSQHVELMLQESCTDQSGSFVVYTTIDVESVQLAMSGEDPSCIPLLPLGFVIVPVEPSNNAPTTTGEANSISSPEGDASNSNHSSGQNPSSSSSSSAGCLLTVGLQVLSSTIASGKVSLSSVNAINNHLLSTVNQITAALSGNCSNPSATASYPLDNASIPLGSCTDANSGAPKQ